MRVCVCNCGSHPPVSLTHSLFPLNFPLSSLHRSRHENFHLRFSFVTYVREERHLNNPTSSFQDQGYNDFKTFSRIINVPRFVKNVLDGGVREVDRLTYHFGEELHVFDFFFLLLRRRLPAAE